LPVVLDRIRRFLRCFFFLVKLWWLELLGEQDEAGISAIKVRFGLPLIWWGDLLLLLLLAGRGGVGGEEVQSARLPSRVGWGLPGRLFDAVLAGRIR